MGGELISGEGEKLSWAEDLALVVVRTVEGARRRGCFVRERLLYDHLEGEAVRAAEFSGDAPGRDLAHLALEKSRSAEDPLVAWQALKSFFKWKEQSLCVFAASGFRSFDLEQMYGAYQAAAELSANTRPYELARAEFLLQFRFRFGTEDIERLRYANPAARLLFDEKNRPFLDEDRMPYGLNFLLGLEHNVIEGIQRQSKYVVK